MKKFIFEESFVSYADLEIYADSKDEAITTAASTISEKRLPFEPNSKK